MEDSLLLRRPPRGGKKWCCTDARGHVTRTFEKVEDLMRCLYGKFGDEWKSCLLLKPEKREKQGDKQRRDNREKQGDKQGRDNREKQGDKQGRDNREKQGDKQGRDNREKQGDKQGRDNREKQGDKQGRDNREKQGDKQGRDNREKRGIDKLGIDNQVVKRGRYEQGGRERKRETKRKSHIKCSSDPSRSSSRPARPSLPAQPVQIEDATDASAGNCLFVALSKLTLPPRTHQQTRMVSQFYQDATSACLNSLSPIYDAEQLRERAEVIARPGEWGEGVDVTAFASIIQKNIEAEVVTAPSLGEVSTVTFHPLDNDGRKINTMDNATQVLHYNGLDHWSILQL